MTDLTPAQRRELRARAHHLNPVVSVSQNGLTPTVLKEIDRSLAAHELIKVRLYGIDRDERGALLEEICASLACSPVQHIGNLLVLWRQNPEGDVKPPRPVRKPSKPLTKKQAAAALEAKPRRRTVR